MIAAAAEAASAPSPMLQTVVSSVVIAAIVGGLFAVAQVVANKRLRAPADKLAEAQFTVKVWQDLASEAKADKVVLEETTEALRSYVADLESRGQQTQELISTLYARIHDLEERSGQKDAQLRRYQTLIKTIAVKVQRGEKVTLVDLDGSDPHPATTP